MRVVAQKVAVVTGAAGGLGSASAKRLLADGWQVVATDASGAGLDRMVEDLSAPEEDLLVGVGDVRDPVTITELVDKALARWGRLDGLVHCAGGDLGLTRGWNPVWEMPEDVWQDHLDVNLTGTLNWVRAVSPAMIEGRSGQMLLVSSGTALRPGRGLAAYAASKAGMIGLMRAAARDLGEFGVQVNVLFPGLTPHPHHWVDAETVEAPHWDAYRADTLLGKLSTTETFAEFVSFLLSVGTMSGQVLNLDSRLVQ
jgi:NAD(P)-dependent dehydrogenase (short-subunit alcohol dehydrogenase family)